MALSAYHTCFTAGELDCRRAYIAMARGSPCVVPSEEETSPLPGITQRICVVQDLCKRYIDRLQ